MNDKFDEDFCYDDVIGISDLDELECMEEDLRYEIDNMKERIDVYEANANVIRERYAKIKNET